MLSLQVEDLVLVQRSRNLQSNNDEYDDGVNDDDYNNGDDNGDNVSCNDGECNDDNDCFMLVINKLHA